MFFLVIYLSLVVGLMIMRDINNLHIYYNVSFRYLLQIH
nr:MAG TPA: hypothetical protein [Caudoviricetes sp.]